MRRIAILGAESTGKSQLALQLAGHLQQRGLRAAAVPEVLREWCTREGRAPEPQEQMAIAREQERRVDAAAAASDIVIADTTALMVAIHAGMLQEEGELLRFAMARQATYDHTLVTGLDLPWVADGLHRDADHPREEVDTLVRALLQRGGTGFQVVYGSGPTRLQGALAGLRSAGILRTQDSAAADEAAAPWVWSCEKCSDPACEHRLFRRLLQARG